MLLLLLLTFREVYTVHWLPFDLLVMFRKDVKSDLSDGRSLKLAFRALVNYLKFGVIVGFQVLGRDRVFEDRMGLGQVNRKEPTLCTFVGTTLHLADMGDAKGIKIDIQH